MILAVDIGNSNVVIGLFDGKQWFRTWRIDSIETMSVHYYQMKLSQYFMEEDVDERKINTIVLSSVVPDLTAKFSAALKQINSDRFLLLDHHLYDTLSVSTSNPFEMGTDLMANAIAAHDLWKLDTIIVDFGTALTFTLVNKNGEIMGVNIVPGIKTAMKALSSNTAQLPEVLVKLPGSILGKTTIEAIQNGVLIGYSGLVKHMIQTIEQGFNCRCKTIATGGLASVLKDVDFDLIDKNLTLNGLRIVAEKYKFE